jgi:hypothetical protein
MAGPVGRQRGLHGGAVDDEGHRGGELAGLGPPGLPDQAGELLDQLLLVAGGDRYGPPVRPGRGQGGINKRAAAEALAARGRLQAVEHRQDAAHRVVGAGPAGPDEPPDVPAVVVTEGRRQQIILVREVPVGRHLPRPRCCRRRVHRYRAGPGPGQHLLGRRDQPLPRVMGSGHGVNDTCKYRLTQQARGAEGSGRTRAFRSPRVAPWHRPHD